MPQNILITGCSGGGKSTLLAQLADKNYPVIEEAGRRVVAQQQATGGTALPWQDMPAFLREVEAMAQADLAAAQNRAGPVFFDRGLIDTLAAHEFHLGDFDAANRAPFNDLSAYDKRVFVAPPWPEIYVQDAVRQHDLELAKREYEHTLEMLPRLGFSPVLLPLTTPEQRAQFVLDTIRQPKVK